MKPNKKDNSPSDTKSSWKTLAGNLFGIQFDQQSDLEDVDLDSAAEMIDQLYAVEKTQAPEEPKKAVADLEEEDLSFDEPDDEQSEAIAAPAVTPAPPAPVAKSKPAPVLSQEDDDDEDPFGFGIVGDENKASRSKPLAKQKSAPQTETVAEEATPARQPKKSSSRGEKKSRSPERSEREEEKPARAVESKDSKESDDFWDALDEWDWDSKEKSKPSSRKSRSRRDEDEDEEETTEVEITAVEAEDAGDDEERPTRRRRRRRRRGKGTREESGRSKSEDSEDVEEVSLEEPKDEVDASLIDELWGSEEDEAVKPVVSAPVTVKAVQEESEEEEQERKPSRRRRRRRSDDSAPAKAEKPEPVPARQSDEEEEDDDDPEILTVSTRPPDPQYRNIPTWSEAIGMIVKNKAPRSASSTSKSGERRGSGRRRPRSRD
ncbi:MAG: hypothetical protein KDA78_05200 [Planctomycetaceae bacterium]|nr:hypothetical protein [Planctomycetaceae bacterium]